MTLRLPAVVAPVWLTVGILCLTIGNAHANEYAKQSNALQGKNIPWRGVGEFRLLVKVAPQRLVGRANDQCPAELTIDWGAELAKLGFAGTTDVASIQIMSVDPISGEPDGNGGYAYGRNKSERPFRWCDDAIPYAFPEFADAVTRTKGKIVRKPRTRGGYFFNAIGDWKSGRLTWMHTQTGQKSNVYAVYFDLLAKDQVPQQIPPRAWIGDGLPRCDRLGATTMGADHCRIELDDWNQDGLVDLIIGEHYGHVFWWPNLGTKNKPEFRYSRFVHADGKPLDAGLAAAPKVIDWDGDGRKDLLVGAHWNRLLFYKNVGREGQRKLSYRGFVTLDGQPLEVPLRPLKRGSPDVFRRDYYPVPEVVDWDRDGDLDLLLGGYITGSVFYFENTGRLEDGQPKLRLAGPLQADGKILNVGHWCAAPCVADFNGDGELDLMSGNMPMHVQPTERDAHAETFLQYFAGSRSNGATALSAVAFPKRGSFPHARLATPRAFDWDDDGDLDLIVSARENVYLFQNTGTPKEPMFAVDSQPLRVPWGLAPIAVDQFLDWDADGDLDLIRGYTAHLKTGKGNPYRWDRKQNVLPKGQYIAHPSGIGDDWFRPFLDDFDDDGRVDVLFGDWFGNVWLHRNVSTNKDRRIDAIGFRLQMNDGQRIKVGPIGKDPKKDFGALQGARTVMTVDDFDRDGRRDLIVGDTYGKIRCYRNLSSKNKGEAKPVFSRPTLIGDLGIRGLVDSTDWNADGWPDVVGSAANGRVRVYLNNKDSGKPSFAAGFDPGLPPIVQPRVLMADINSDGDQDLFLPSTQGSCFVERSFLTNGYAKGELITAERKP